MPEASYNDGYVSSAGNTDKNVSTWDIAIMSHWIFQFTKSFQPPLTEMSIGDLLGVKDDRRM